MLIQDKSHKVMSENPYSDTKTKTTYAWNMDTEAFQFVKGSQNLYNNSIKKKNYFYPHVGAHGGAGGMRTYKYRDTTPMKFTLTTMSHSSNPTQYDVISVNRLNTQAGTSMNRQKARELKITGGSMNRKETSNMMFPKVQKINNANYSKNDGFIGSSKVIKSNQIKVIENYGYPQGFNVISEESINSKYQNKFFPRRNITSKLKSGQGLSRKGTRKPQNFGPKGYVIDKENRINESNINPTNVLSSITGSVPSRVSSKVASSSFIKGSPNKKTYFSPNWKYTPYQNMNSYQPPVYNSNGWWFSSKCLRRICRFTRGKTRNEEISKNFSFSNRNNKTPLIKNKRMPKAIDENQMISKSYILHHR